MARSSTATVSQTGGWSVVSRATTRRSWTVAFVERTEGLTAAGGEASIGVTSEPTLCGSDTFSEPAWSISRESSLVVCLATVAGSANTRRVEMVVSDQLSKLAARAKEAEDRAAAAQNKARAELEQDVERARSSAQAQADKLRASADANKGKLSVWWNDIQRSWDEHIQKIRSDIDSKRAEHDVDRAQRNAENAEDDAAFAVEYAYAAIEEAEYAVLDATLARMEADELAGAATSART
jgi:Cu/Ag efflux pump CusA